jgi:hypothetical protein
MEHPRSPDRIERRADRTRSERLRSLARNVSTNLSTRFSTTLQLRASYATLILALGIALALGTRSPGAPPAASGAPGNSVSNSAPPSSAAAPSNPELSRAQAIELVQVRYRARVVRSSETLDKSGRRLYVLRLLSGGGKVWTVHIDAHTGAEVP